MHGANKAGAEMQYAEQYMLDAHLQLQCVCAPMFGLRRRQATVRVDERLVATFGELEGEGGS